MRELSRDCTAQKSKPFTIWFFGKKFAKSWSSGFMIYWSRNVFFNCKRLVKTRKKISFKMWTTFSLYSLYYTQHNFFLPLPERKILFLQLQDVGKWLLMDPYFFLIVPSVSSCRSKHRRQENLWKDGGVKKCGTSRQADRFPIPWKRASGKESQVAFCLGRSRCSTSGFLFLPSLPSSSCRHHRWYPSALARVLTTLPADQMNSWVYLQRPPNSGFAWHTRSWVKTSQTERILADY